MSMQKPKTPEDELLQQMASFRKDCEDTCDAVDKSALDKKRTSGTIDSSKSKKDKKQIKKSDMKMENPYGMPNPNPQNTEDYNMTKSEKQRTYTQKDIDKANGPRVASAYNDNHYYNKQDSGKVANKSQEDKESTEDLQAQMLELNKKRSEILKDGTAQEFKDVEKKLRDIQKTLKARGADYSTLEDTLNDHGKKTDSSKIKKDEIDKHAKVREDVLDKMEARGDNVDEYRQRRAGIPTNIDDLAENELADQLERERNKDAGKEVDEIDTLGDEELADRFEREKGKATKEDAEGSNPETVTAANESEAQQEKMEELKNALDSARGNYTKLQYKSEGMLNKIKGMLGNVNTSEDQDVAGRQEVYKNALAKYRDARIAEAKGLSGEEQEKIIAELEAFDANEHINLYDARVDAKAETFAGKLGEMTNKLVQGYKKLPTSVKIGLSGALFVGGLATGTGVAAGLIGTATIGKRALGAGAMGIGMTGWREAKAQEKEQEKIRINLEELQQGLSIEERIAQLSGYDEASFSELNSAFKGKIAGRSRRVMLGLATTAAAMSVGEVAKLFGGAEHVGMPTSEHVGGENVSQYVSAEDAEHITAQAKYGSSVFEGMTSHFTDEMKETDAYARFQSRYGRDAYLKFLDNGGDESKWERRVSRAQRMYESMAKTKVLTNTAHELAQQMGIDDPGHITFTSEGNIPTEINGHPVPEELLTEDQRASIASARSIRDTMQGGNDSENIVRRSANADSFFGENNTVLPKIHYATAGVNEGPGTPWLEEELAAAKELSATDRVKMEEYLMKLNQGEAIQSGTVNEELLKQQAQEAFAQYNLTGKVPEVPLESSLPVENPIVQPELAEIIVPVKSGDTLWSLIEEQLETNSQFSDMTEGQKIMAIDELKDKFAGMSSSDLKDIGIESGDIHEIVTDEKLNLTSIMSNSEQVQHSLETGKAFDGKLETWNGELEPGNSDEIATLGKENVIEAKSAVEDSVTEKSSTIGDVVQNQPQAQDVENVANATATKSGWIDPDTGNEYADNPRTLEDVENIRKEASAILEISKDPNFLENVRHTFNINGSPSENMVHGLLNAPMSTYKTFVSSGNVDDIIGRAETVFRHNIGSGDPNIKIGTMYARIFAEAKERGVIDQIFTSSK